MSKASEPEERTVRVPQQERSRTTRARIVQSALLVFEERGYDATTTAQIAAESGIAVGTLYGYFRDKREILLEVVDDVLEPVVDQASALLSEENCTGRQLEDVVFDLVASAFFSQALKPGFQRVLWECYFRDEQFQAPLVELRGRICDAIVDFAKRQEPSGRLRPVPLEAAAFAILHLVQWNATQAFMHLDRDQSADVVTVTVDMVMRYLFFDAPDATDDVKAAR